MHHDEQNTMPDEDKELRVAIDAMNDHGRRGAVIAALNRIRMSWGHNPSIDPWVVVGRTTIDGTLAQVGGAMLNGGKPSTLRHDTIEDFIDGKIKTGSPILVGGRWLRLVGAHINSHTDTAVVRCDIVRRQSEIDAEKVEASIARMGEAIAEVKAEQCPECGPHGNRGRVVLAFSEVACTVCAGGVSGDAFGLVQRESFNCGDAECSGCDTCFPTVR